VRTTETTQWGEKERVVHKREKNRKDNGRHNCGKGGGGSNLQGGRRDKDTLNLRKNRTAAEKDLTKKENGLKKLVNVRPGTNTANVSYYS